MPRRTRKARVMERECSPIVTFGAPAVDAAGCNRLSDWMIALLAIVLAQTPTTANLPATGIAIDVLRPSFRGSVDRSLISAAAYLSGRAPIGRAHLLFEVPFAHQDTEFSGSSTMV